LRLKALRNEAIDAVREYYGEEFSPRIEELKRKLTNGEALSSEESDILYPLINDTEFIGRLFKSQRLQQILNNKESAVDGQGILSRIWEFVKSIFDGLGFNIKDNSVLAYALTDV